MAQKTDPYLFHKLKKKPRQKSLKYWKWQWKAQSYEILTEVSTRKRLIVIDGLDFAEGCLK